MAIFNEFRTTRNNDDSVGQASDTDFFSWGLLNLNGFKNSFVIFVDGHDTDGTLII
jgi:hypothetical protein